MTKLRISRETAKEAIRAANGVLQRCGFLRRWEWCGSYRRGRPTVGDFDLAAWVSVSTIAERIVLAERIRAALVAVVPGAQLDLRYVSGPEAPYAWPAMVLYLTGPRNWNVWCRVRVMKAGLLLNEYGLWHRDLSNVRASYARTERTLLLDSRLPPISPRARDKWSGWKGAAVTNGGEPQTGGPQAPPNPDASADPMRAA